MADAVVEMDVQDWKDGELCLARPESCAENLGCPEVEEKTYWPNESFSSAWIDALSEN